MKKHYLIRGPRILDQLNQLDEATYASLEQNTLTFVPQSKRRQWAVDPVQIVKMELSPARESQDLIIRAEVNSSGNSYNASMIFDGVIYEESDQNDNISFVAADNEEYHIIPIELNKNNVKVSCDCLDFYWRFANANHNNQSLNGPPPPAYAKKTNRPAANPSRVPGVCKHLLKLAIQLKSSKIVR